MRTALVLHAFGQDQNYVAGDFKPDCAPDLHVWADYPTDAGTFCCCGMYRFLQAGPYERTG